MKQLLNWYILREMQSSKGKKVLNCAIYFWMSFAQNYFPFEEGNKESLLRAYYDDYHTFVDAYRFICNLEILKMIVRSKLIT